MMLALLMLLVLGGTPDSAPRVEDLAWMTGHWRSEENGKISEEIWTSGEGAILLGLHRDISGEKRAWEYLRIEERADGLTYFASPSGRPATAFVLTKLDHGFAQFENPDHDFPKRIVYWRDGDSLCAKADDGEGNGPEWCWSRM